MLKLLLTPKESLAPLTSHSAGLYGARVVTAGGRRGSMFAAVNGY